MYPKSLLMTLFLGLKDFYSKLSQARAGVRAKLAEQGIDPMDVAGLDDVFEEILHPFDGLETACKQEKYYKDCLGLVVSDTAWLYIVHQI